MGLGGGGVVLFVHFNLLFLNLTGGSWKAWFFMSISPLNSLSESAACVVLDEYLFHHFDLLLSSAYCTGPGFTNLAAIPVS